MKPFKKETIGWHLGTKFRVISHKKWGNNYIYKLRFMHNNSRWIEYMSHTKLKKERCFAFSELWGF
jgi:hypothetical protein